MQLQNSEKQYGAVTKLFHWLTAFIVIGLLAVGLYMSDMPAGPDKFTLYALHKSFGVVVLVLILGRLFWHIISHRPRPVETLKPWERHLSKALHNAFYILLFAMPMTGWIFSSAASHPVSFFGLFTLPDLVSPDKAVAKIFRELHGDIGTIIMIVLGLHVAAALKHQFIDKDTVLKRMLPW